MYASAELQSDWETNSFVKAIPWTHFSRKNLGYLYAIAQGAEYIWDVDDDNFLKQGADPFELPKKQLSRSVVATVGIESVHSTATNATRGNASGKHSSCLALPGYNIYNPYPLYGCSSCYPRGFPLSCVAGSESSGLSITENIPDVGNAKQSRARKVVVWQSLADKNPDIDAIQRLTSYPQSQFSGQFSDRGSTVIDKNVYVPYNAQATLHHRNGFFALLLPKTVNGRVSDIWRSYLSQRLFWDCDKLIGFTSPVVVHERNSHNLRADFEAEWPLYYETEALLKVLSEFHKPGLSLEDRMKRLWGELYERAFIEKEDLDLVAQWWTTLRDLGYSAPEC